MQSLETLFARRPDDARAFTLLGHVRARAGQHELALRSYEEALRLGGDAQDLAPLMDRSRRALAAGGGAHAAR
jgi:cytochrome c-type biogenesis protein CcmH/NrfG